MSGGRPSEGRVRIVAHVLPLTAERIARLLDKSDARVSTIGKVVDQQFGVETRAHGRKRRSIHPNE